MMNLFQFSFKKSSSKSIAKNRLQKTLAQDRANRFPGKREQLKTGSSHTNRQSYLAPQMPAAGMISK